VSLFYLSAGHCLSAISLIIYFVPTRSSAARFVRFRWNVCLGSSFINYGVSLEELPGDVRRLEFCRVLPHQALWKGELYTRSESVLPVPLNGVE